MYRVMWRLISALLGLLGFTVTALMSLMTGDDLLTTVIKGIASFLLLWIFFSILGTLFQAVVPTGDEDDIRPVKAGQDEDTVPVRDVFDNDLPDLPDLGLSTGLGQGGK